jgi:hypothetical protein
LQRDTNGIEDRGVDRESPPGSVVSSDGAAGNQAGRVLQEETIRVYCDQARDVALRTNDGQAVKLSQLRHCWTNGHRGRDDGKPSRFHVCQELLERIRKVIDAAARHDRPGVEPGPANDSQSDFISPQ